MRLLAIILIYMISLSFCGYSVFADPVRVALVLDRGGKEDKSFNSAAHAGASKAQKELGIELKYVEAPDLNSFESMHRSFAKKKFDLIVGVGFAQSDAVKKVAGEFPNQKFAIVDAEVNLPNVKSLMFEEHEGSFLVGALAALQSKQNKFGFIGGMDIPLIRRFQMGYQAGVKHVNPKAEVISQYIGVTGEAWNNPSKAKELALAQYNSQIDVIFAAAGASGSGVFDAASEKKKFAIGVDSNQNWMKPGTVLTSMLKRVDVAVFDAIKDLKESKFSFGVSRFGLKNKGIDFALDQHNEKLISSKTQSQLEAIKQKIIAGQISVPDYYKKK